MTLPHEPGLVERAIDRELANIDPIRVRIVADDTPMDIEAATYGTWEHYTFLGTTADVPFQIAPQSPKRKRAVLYVTPGIAGNVTGFVVVGQRNVVANGQAQLGLTGGLLVNGMPIVVESQSEIWIMSDAAHSLTINILDERYR